MDVVTEHLDVIVVGAGLSGIGAAYHLKSECPGKRFAIFEGRERLGGTWDLFRYPGIRSDSDMFTLGYRFKPWTDPKAIADGPSILKYIRETAEENGLDRAIRYQHRVQRASWSSKDARWTVEVACGPEQKLVTYTCSFLYWCSGYYRYDAGYTPELPGLASFGGRVVHPQQWTEDIDYAGKRVVVIGSGATAMTLVPSLAKTAAHVVMLQRSPTYVVSLPAQDSLANRMRAVLPERVAYGVTRWKNVARGMAFFEASRKWPKAVRGRILQEVRKELGPEYDLRKHFAPRYKVWDQRVCLVPDSDLFEAIRSGRASVVTDHIERITERGVLLRSGEELHADLLVTATGLELVFLGGAQLEVDGVRIEPGQLLNYKGCMFRDVPNLACTFGYTNASWTLKADLTAEYVCRLLKRMDAKGARTCTPRLRDPEVQPEDAMSLQSGYVQRAADRMPKQGSKRPWKLYQNYALDLMLLRHAPIEDGSMELG